MKKEDTEIIKYLIKKELEWIKKEKAEIEFPSLNFLKSVLKKHSKKKEDLGDKRALFSINAELSGAFKVIAASAGDWDFNRAIHKLMHKIEEEIEHRFHSSEQRS